MRLRVSCCFYSILILSLFVSCAGSKNGLIQQYQLAGNCNEQGETDFSDYPLPQPIHEIELDSTLLANFSPESLNIANAIGLLGLLQKYIGAVDKLNTEPSIENRFERLEALQEIYQRINISSLELSAVASEMDCEEERLEQIADFLNSKEKDRETRLTVGAITIGALAAIGAGVLVVTGEGRRNDDNIEFVGIGAGIIEATLGLMILTNKKKVDYYHPRNALREIWEGQKNSEIFPPSVWYFLNYFDPSRPETPSRRYVLLENWMSFRQITDVRKEKKREQLDLYFGDGGQYSTEELYNRSNMYDQLEAQIKLMKQHLNRLSNEIDNLKIAHTL